MVGEGTRPDASQRLCPRNIKPHPEGMGLLNYQAVEVGYLQDKLPDFLPAQQSGAMGRCTATIVNEFAVRPDLLRRAVAQHKTWMEGQLGVSLSDVVILETDLDIAQVGVELLLAVSLARRATSSVVKRLRPFVLSAATPPEFPPLCEISKAPRTANLLAWLGGRTTLQKSALSWQDCPIALRLRRSESEFTVIAFNFSYHSGPGSDYETTARLIVARRENASEVVRLLEELDRRDNKPRLHVVGSSNRRIVGCKWDDLVLDYKVHSMLRDDFEAFFERQAWFRANKLPFRRGCLLHGPPGNGKSTAIRAMMSSRGLTAYTMRLFTDQLDDSDLDSLFDLAVKNRPSMVLLEDLDRAFPKTGETKSRISLQALLNALDGVGTGEGIVVVATANEPTILDPAILRRPGRFDRVVHFPNPSAELRQQYLQQLNPGLPPRHLKLSVELWELGTDFVAREQVCALVRYHQSPFHLVSREDSLRLAFLISQTTRCDLLSVLTRADALGRKCADRQQLLESIDLFEEYCREHRCLYAAKEFPSPHSRFQYFRTERRDPDYLAHEDFHCEVTMMSGLPGAGKDTWIKRWLPELPVISLDAIRVELGQGATGKQGKVIHRAREMARDFLRQRRDFVWNATNLGREIRGQLVDLFTDYQARVRVVYVEEGMKSLYRNNANRSAAVPLHAIMEMMNRWEVPTPLEADRVEWWVNEQQVGLH